MKERLFLSANFSDFCIGLARENSWIYQCQEQGYIASQLTSVLTPCLEEIHWEDLSVFLLNGPGSTLGIRTLCAFGRTLLTLDKIPSARFFVCDTLHFAHAYLRFEQKDRIVCARVNLTQTLCVSSEFPKIHVASAEEQAQAIWLPHPCLTQNTQIFHFQMERVLPLLKSEREFWVATSEPDVFDYQNYLAITGEQG